MISDAEIAQAKADLTYPEFRAWWAANVMLRKTWRSRAVKPPPGTVDGSAEDEAG